MLDPTPNFFRAVSLATPAIDLSPAGDARLDPMPREVTVHRFVIKLLFSLGVNGVGARSDERQVAGEDDVEELGQLVKAGPANETADLSYPGIVPGDQLTRRHVGVLHIH